MTSTEKAIEEFRPEGLQGPTGVSSGGGPPSAGGNGSTSGQGHGGRSNGGGPWSAEFDFKKLKDRFEEPIEDGGLFDDPSAAKAR